MAKGVMHKFKLNEISAVDRPAQGGALMAIIKRDASAGGPYLAKRDGEANLPAATEAYLKRDFTQDQRDRAASSGAALPDGSFPIENRADLRNAVRAVGRASNPAKAKAHIVSRARALGATGSLPDTWKSANFPLLANLTNEQACEGLAKALELFKGEQAAAGFSGEHADAVGAEYANGLVQEIGDAVCSLRAVHDEIMEDAVIKAKDEALQESFGQFTAHLKGIIPEGIENGLVGAALAEAGYTVNERGALTKRETEMGFDIRKALGLSATATEADVEKAMTDKMAAFGKADTTSKTLGNILKMSAAHTSFMSNEKAKMPEGGKEAFANMSADDRDSHIKAHPLEKANKKAEDCEDEDEDDAEKCIKLATGEVIRKSVVGDGTFAFMKSQQDRIAKMENQEATAVFTKRAETVMPYIGKADELGGLLRSIAKLSGGENIAEAVAKKFEQLNEVIKKGGATLLTEVGKGGGAGGSFAKASDQIETIAKQLIADGKAKNMFKARDMARQANPDLRKQESAEADEARKTRAA